MRKLFPAGLFLLAALALMATDALGQNKAKPAPKKAKAKYALPAVTKPDTATLKTITEKTKQLADAVKALNAKKVPADVLIEVDIFRKAAEYIVKYNEWLHRDSGKWALTALDRGLERAKQAEGGKAPWRAQTGVWVARAYRSEVDGSIQPYAVLLPRDYGKDAKKTWRLDVVLHGRDGSLTEAKFLASHDRTKEGPKDQDFVQLEVYGRGNNAYRWAGETDFGEAVTHFLNTELERRSTQPIDMSRFVLRGFSMGGAGTWHLGLHHPDLFAVIGPGAGFTTTHGYIKNLPNPLPDYQEKCLTIYDAVRYAENVFNVPVVAYSGEKDGQKAAADNIEALVKAFPEKLRFQHLVAPGLEHKMPPEWQAKAETEYRKFAGPGKPFPARVRFVTYTLKYPRYGWGELLGLGEHYKKAILEGAWKTDRVVIRTENVHAFTLEEPAMFKDVYAGTLPTLPRTATVDEQPVPLHPVPEGNVLVKERNQWRSVTRSQWNAMARQPGKRPRLQGPIDDAFTSKFVVVPPAGKGWHAATDAYAADSLKRFGREWNKYMRHPLPTAKAPPASGNLILFGDPASNPLIAKVVAKLPITWTKDQLVVNGVEYDPKTHVPVMISPNPLNAGRGYVVLNSGHTFHEADFKGTNALLYPRLGDWAVLKPAPTTADPAAADVMAAGLFDEAWQFPKK